MNIPVTDWKHEYGRFDHREAQGEYGVNDGTEYGDVTCRDWCEREVKRIGGNLVIKEQITVDSQGRKRKKIRIERTT